MIISEALMTQNFDICDKRDCSTKKNLSFTSEFAQISVSLIDIFSRNN